MIWRAIFESDGADAQQPRIHDRRRIDPGIGDRR